MRFPPLRRPLVFARFVGWLVLELLLANARVAAIVLRPKGRFHPAVFRMRPPVSSDRVLVGLADLITLTPGTITTGIQGDDLEVHSLTWVDVDGREEDEMDRRVTWVEQGG